MNRRGFFGAILAGITASVLPTPAPTPQDDLQRRIRELARALEAGGYNARPTALRNGCAMDVEDLSGVMHNVTFSDKHIRLGRIHGYGDA